MQIKCVRANENADFPQGNQIKSNQNKSLRRKTLEADQKPSAPAWQLILGKNLEHFILLGFPYHSTFLQTEARDVQINWLFCHDF